MPLVEIKDFNAIINNKPFFDHLLKIKQEAFGKIIEISRSYEFTARNLLDYLLYIKYVEFIRSLKIL